MPTPQHKLVRLSRRFLYENGSPEVVFDEIERLDERIDEVKGDKGEMGPMGLTGAKGDTVIGPQGLMGEKGERGLRGPKGETGNQGPMGLPGEPGRHGRDGLDAVLEMEPLVAEVVKEIKKKKLDIKDIANAVLYQPKKLDMSDLRWHGGGGGTTGLTEVTHDNTLTGKGTVASPLSVVGGGGSTNIQSVNLSSQCDGNNKTFTLPTFGGVLLLTIGSTFPGIYNPDTDFIIPDSTHIVLTDAVSAPESGQTLIALTTSTTPPSTDSTFDSGKFDEAIFS